MEKFQLSNFTKQGEQLLSDVRQEFKNLNIDDTVLPKVFSDDDDKIKLVFVGQYSAGKSSIIKMLTNEDVAIGEKITTQSASAYPWNGLEIIDTPGIHTELRPDHDDLTYEQINHAALLIFVITNEGFSQRLGDHFRTLAIDQKRAANMVLVVNKMDRAAQGNTLEQQQVIARDLEKVTQPYKPSDLYLSFLDTSSYFKALEETDERRRTRRLERSGHDTFVDNLNKFVKDHKTLAKVTKPLYTIADILRGVIESGTNDKNNAVVAFTDTIEHKKDLVVEGKKQYERNVKELLTQFKNDVEKIGRDVAISVIDSGNREAAEKILENANDKVAKLVTVYSNKINEGLITSFESVGANIQTYENTAFVQQVNNRMTEQVKFELNLGKALPGGALAALGALTAQYGAQIAAPYAVVATRTITQVVPDQMWNAALGKFVNWGSTAFMSSQGVPVAFAKKAGSAIGSKAEGLQLFTKTVTKVVPLPPTFTNKVAQFFTANAGKIGTALSILGAAWSLYSLYKDYKKREEEELKQIKAREEIIANFNSVADDVAAQLMEGVKTSLKENVDPMISNFEDSINQIEAGKEQTKIANEKFGELLKRTENLIAEIQN